MPHVMLRPNWPGQFVRTIEERKTEIRKGKKVTTAELLRRVTFAPGDAVEVSDRELAALRANGDVGTALFEVEFDAKRRPRLLEPQAEPTEPEVAQAE